MGLFTVTVTLLAMLSSAACDRHKPDTMNFLVTSSGGLFYCFATN